MDPAEFLAQAYRHLEWCQGQLQVPGARARIIRRARWVLGMIDRLPIDDSDEGLRLLLDGVREDFEAVLRAAGG